MEDLEYKISLLLRRGVLLSAFFLAMGVIGSLFSPSKPLESYSTYQAVSFLIRLENAWDESSWFTLISYLGLMILISLPLIRVFLTGILFVKNKEKAMGIMAFLVFIILVASFFLGIEL
ncbi:MAG: DUF1634 domain-containing protein [Bacteriovoracaceae bacterium]